MFVLTFAVAVAVAVAVILYFLREGGWDGGRGERGKGKEEERKGRDWCISLVTAACAFMHACVRACVRLSFSAMYMYIDNLSAM